MTTDTIIELADDLDLVYSPDDGGWYFQQFIDHYAGYRCSITYSSEKAAMADFPNAILWEEN
jgi:hypothetical protein